MWFIDLFWWFLDGGKSSAQVAKNTTAAATSPEPPETLNPEPELFETMDECDFSDEFNEFMD